MSLKNKKHVLRQDLDAFLGDAMRLHQAGHFEEAIGLYRKIVKTEPRHVPALNNLAIAFWQFGRAQDALPWVQKSLRLDPDNITALNTQGLIATSMQDFARAEKSFRKALGLKPDYAEAYFNLARVYFMDSQWSKALKTATYLLDLKPDHKNAAMIRLTALAELDRFDDLDTDWANIFAGSAQSVFCLYLEGRIYLLSGQAKPALDCFDTALGLEPDNVLALHGKAAALIDLDDKEAARESLLRLLDQTPDHALALKLLSSIHEFSAGDDVVRRLDLAEKQLGRMNEKERAELYYTRAKYYGDTGDNEQCFSYWRKGAAEKCKTLIYDWDGEARKLEEIKDAFMSLRPVSADSGLQRNDSAAHAVTPVFIIGMPRSGTSLMEQILASHDAVKAKGELRLLSRVLGDYDDLETVAGRYMDGLAMDSNGARHITDKMPYNYRYLGLIHKLMPQAKILHMKRNPADVCLSCFSIIFHTGHEWSYDLDDLARYYKLYDAMMNYWRDVLPPQSFLEVCYEDLVSDMEGETKRVLDYCGLDWDDACLDFHKNKRVVGTASTQQVRQPIYHSSVEKWRRYEAQLQPLLEALKPVMEKQGYKL